MNKISLKITKPSGETFNKLLLLTQKYKDFGHYDNYSEVSILQLNEDVNFIITSVQGNDIGLKNTSKLTNGTYFWDFGDGFTSNEFDPLGHSYLTLSAYTITLSYRGTDKNKIVSKKINLKDTNVLSVNNNINTSISTYTITGKTNSYLSELMGYRRRELNVGDSRNNKTIIEKGDDYIVYVDNTNDLPITYKDNGLEAIFSYKITGQTNYILDENTIFIKSEGLVGYVERPTFNNSFDFTKFGSNPFDSINLITQRNNIGDIEKLGIFTIF